MKEEEKEPCEAEVKTEILMENSFEELFPLDSYGVNRIYLEHIILFG